MIPIDQASPNKDELEKIAKACCEHKIIFGAAEDIDTKFKKLMIFYTHGLSKVGWNVYSEINLKFKDNVVCKK